MEILTFLFSLQIALQGPTVPVFKKQDCDLWLKYSSKMVPRVHCPIGSGDSETSPVARQKSSNQIEGDL